MVEMDFSNVYLTSDGIKKRYQKPNQDTCNQGKRILRFVTQTSQTNQPSSRPPQAGASKVHKMGTIFFADDYSC